MAYWNINFRSIDNTAYKISVGGKSGNVDSTLYGASKPFSVDEDDDDDVFRTVRLQTGYIRILDIGVDVEEAPFDWHDLIPSNATSRPVTLYKGNDVIWRGFLRPETYGGEYLMERQERAFPIFGQLSALEAFDCDLNAAEFMNFGGLLYHIFSQERGLWTKFFFQGADATSTWLFKKFYTSLFVEEDDGELKYKRNCLEALEDVCQFFGWTAREFMGNIYFCMAGDSYRSGGFKGISWNQLYNIAGGITVSPESLSNETLQLEDIQIKSADNNERYVPGIRNAIVNQEVGLMDEIIDLATDKVSEILDKTTAESYAGGYFIVGSASADGLKTLVQREDLSDVETVIPQSLGVRRHTFDNVVIEEDVDISGAHTPQGTSCGAYERRDYPTGNWSTIHDIDWTTVYRVWYNSFFANGNSDFSCLRMKSRFPYSLQSGILSISGTTRVDEASGEVHKTYNGYCNIQCRLKIGDKYWNGTDWTTSSTATFLLTVGADSSTGWQEGTGTIPSNRMAYNTTTHAPNLTDPNYDGYGIPINTAVSGIIVFEILQVYNTSGHFDAGYQTVSFSDLKFTFRRSNDVSNYSQKRENVYKEASNAAFSDDYEVNTIFTTDEGNGFGEAIILNTDGSYCDGIEYSSIGGGIQESPGKHLAEAIASFKAKPRQILEIDLNDNGTIFAPNNIIQDDEGYSYIPISISRNIIDNKARVIMINID